MTDKLKAMVAEMHILSDESDDACYGTIATRTVRAWADRIEAALQAPAAQAADTVSSENGSAKATRDCEVERPVINREDAGNRPSSTVSPAAAQAVAWMHPGDLKVLADNPDDYQAASGHKVGPLYVPLYTAPLADVVDDVMVAELRRDLTVFDIGLTFALCQNDFGQTRNSIKKLQHDFKAITAAIDAALAARGAS